MEWGYTGFNRCLSVRLSVRPSVRPSVCRQGFRNFSKKNIGSINFIPGIYPYGVGLLTPSHFRVPSLIFGPSGDQIFGRKWGFRKILKKLLAQFISYLTFTLMGWVSWTLYVFVFLASFSALWWPNIWPKSGFPELFEKIIGSIHFILYLAFTLMGWASWPLYIFVFLASFSAL